MGNIFTYQSPKSPQDTCFELRYTSNQLQKEGVRLQRLAEIEKIKIKEQLTKGNLETARFHGEKYVFYDNQATSMLKSSNKLLLFSMKITQLIRMNGAINNMKELSFSLSNVSSNINSPEMVTKFMSKFERQMEDLEIGEKFMESSMTGMTGNSTSISQVDDVMNLVMEENGLEIKNAMSVVPSHEIDTITSNQLKELDEMTKKQVGNKK